MSQPDRRAPSRQSDDAYLSSAIKGIIALFITILIVVVIVMLFAKSLFVPNTDNKKVKTGHLTETVSFSAETTKAAQEVEEVKTTKKKKKTTTKAEEPETPVLPDGLDTSVAGEYVISSAVYLHPEPNSSSANLATLPAGETVTVYGNSNYGWYYLDYNGQLGYAWSSYLSKKN